MDQTEFISAAPPQKLYKFRAIETEEDWCRLQSILLKHELYCPSPKKFNDPFDCRIPPVGTVNPGFARYLICPDNPCRAAGELSLIERSQLENFLREVQSSIYETGVLSLAATHISTLMWSHYARDHRGVALEFDTIKWRDQMPCMNGQFHLVSYSQHRVKLMLTREHYDRAQLFNAAILTKDLCWKNEEEWRVLRTKPGCLKFPVSSLTGVIFGCCTPDENKARLREVCAPLPEVEFYQAKIKTHEFGLDFEPC